MPVVLFFRACLAIFNFTSRFFSISRIKRHDKRNVPASLRIFELKYQSLKMSSLENPFLTLIISHGRYSAIVSPTRGASFEASAMMRTAFTILLYLRSWCFYNNQFQCSIIQILNIHFCIDRYF